MPPSHRPCSCRRLSPVFLEGGECRSFSETLAAVREARPAPAPGFGQRGSLVRLPLALGLRNAGNASSVGFFLPACRVEPCSLRLDGEGGRLPREQWETWPLRGSVGSRVQRLSLLPLHFRLWRYSLVAILPSPAERERAACVRSVRGRVAAEGSPRSAGGAGLGDGTGGRRTWSPEPAWGRHRPAGLGARAHVGRWGGSRGRAKSGSPQSRPP